MNRIAIQHRCWNHENREAACRCPGCGRPFCRECVTEHETRLLCSKCLARRASGALAGRRGARKLAPILMFLAGLFLAWLFFLGAGAGAVELELRMERAAWQSR
jgi:hypothetical protein